MAFHNSTSAIVSVRNAPERKVDTGLKEKPIMTQKMASDPNITARPMHSTAIRLISSIGASATNWSRVGERFDRIKSH